MERVPVRSSEIAWNTDESGMVTLEKTNSALFDKIAQKLFKRPRVSYIHLDETGSFVWPLIDGEKSIMEIGADVDAHFGEDAHPLYERLAKYFQIMHSYGFISFK